MRRFLAGVSSVSLGALGAYFGLMRLGFRRHGTPWYDVSYFANAPTAAHLGNVVVLACGVACMVGGGWLALRRRARSHAQR